MTGWPALKVIASCTGQQVLDEGMIEIQHLHCDRLVPQLPGECDPALAADACGTNNPGTPESG